MSTNHLRRLTQTCAVIAATVGLASPVAAQRYAGVTVYADVNFSGTSQVITGDVANLGSLGLNDTISSIAVPAGEVWEICRDAGYQNDCRQISGSVADLRSMNFNDEISSIRRVDNNRVANRRLGGYRNDGYRTDGYRNDTPATSPIVVYANPNFGGRRATLSNDTPNVGAYGLNDQITSIDIPSGESWEVCQDVNYVNQCTVISESISDLRAIGWNDRISSLRRVGGGYRDRAYRDDGYRDYRGTSGVFGSNVNNGLVFYNRPNFQGAATRLSETTATSLPARGSLRIQSGVWQVCDVRGACATVDRDVPDVGALGLSGRITTVRELNRSPYYRR